MLTGFKYIGEVILNLEKKGEENRYLFGFEESYGYLAGTYVRDKDAVVASMLICEMTAYYRKQGISLAQMIDDLYKEYGYYLNQTFAFEFEGAAGMQKMSDIMSSVRADLPKAIDSTRLLRSATISLKRKPTLSPAKQPTSPSPPQTLSRLTLKETTALSSVRAAQSLRLSSISQLSARTRTTRLQFAQSL